MSNTFEDIMARMMAEQPSGVDTSEGSFLWNACAKLAYELETAYETIAEQENNLLVDTQDLDHLIRSGAEAGVIYKEATSAIFKAVINCEVDVGTRFSHIEYEYNYVVTEIISDTEYKLEAEEGGAALNNLLGEIEPIEYIPEFESGELTELLTPGTDDEDEEAYRQRRLEYFGINPFGGNRAYYIQEVKNIENVGGVKLERRASEEDNIIIHITNESYEAASQEIINIVQEVVDPDDGEGTGIAPIGHKVLIQSVEEVTINIATELTLNSGYIIADLQSYINEAVSDYLLDLSTDWENQEYIVVRIAQIESKILEITGIIDIANTTINNIADNLSLTEYQIPKEGDILCS